MRKPLAFVFSGGGARGALQVGAVQALVEAGYTPDMLVGTSVGAVNACYLAIHGVNLTTIQNLKRIWLEIAKVNLLPENYLWLTVRYLFNRPIDTTAHRMEHFFLSQGLEAGMRFEDIQGVRLYLVSADLIPGKLKLYGTELTQLIYEGLLASTAIPPWLKPIEKTGEMLIDGGAVSNLPIEPAMAQGAQEIIALDLEDLRGVNHEVRGFGPFVARLIHTVEHRQVQLELALAQARKIPVHYINLTGDHSVALWDFKQTAHLIEEGYKMTVREIARWKGTPEPSLFGKIKYGLKKLFN